MAKKDSISIRLEEDIDAELAAAAKEHGISKQDIIRQALHLGLPVFNRAMARALAEARGQHLDREVAA